ncbi:MAG: hypothetical protein ABI707_12450 [Ferruginibacter sp.]
MSTGKRYQSIYSSGFFLIENIASQKTGIPRQAKDKLARKKNPLKANRIRAVLFK